MYTVSQACADYSRIVVVQVLLTKTGRGQCSLQVPTIAIEEALNGSVFPFPPFTDIWQTLCVLVSHT